MEDQYPFYDIITKINQLYISYRQRFVIAVNGRTFIPHIRNSDGESVPAALTDKYLFRHLNRQFAVGVYAGPYASKFVCFDVDLPDPDLVRNLIAALVEFGFPKNAIHVSTSGGKGYHVEIFFSDTVYTNHLIDMYTTICTRYGFDTKKVEFRPTFKQAIKLPLSKHPKTGKVCWFLDRDTLDPIKDMDYVLRIVPLDRDWVTSLIKRNRDCEVISSPETEGEDRLPQEELPPALTRFAEEYPMLVEPGTRHDLMLSIAVHERYRNTPMEDIERLLLEWVKEQPPQLISSTAGEIAADASAIASWVWSKKFALSSRSMCVCVTEGDLAQVLKQRARLRKRLLFLIVAFARRYGDAKMSAVRMSRFIGGSPNGIVKALAQLEEEGIIGRKPGKRRFTENGVRAAPNAYTYVGVANGDGDGASLEFRWDYQPETFDEFYLSFMRKNVPPAERHQYFTTKELDELEGANHAEDCAAV